MDEKTLIAKLCYIDKEFDKYKENFKEKGYIFVIVNSIYSTYNEKVFILDYGENKKSIREKYNKNYIEKIKIIRSIKNEYVEMIYKILLILLDEYRVVKGKNFFVNDTEVKKELDMIEINFKKRDGLDTYINYVITSINKNYGNIQNYKNKLKITKVISLECVNQMKNLSAIKISKINDNTVELIKNYSSPIRKNGFIVIISSDMVEKYFSGKMSYLLVSNKYKEKIDSIFVFEPNITAFRVYDYELCELLVKDKLKNVNILNGYYMCGMEKIKEVYDEIIKYFVNYIEIESIKKAYLFNEYGIGQKIKEEKVEIKYDIKKSANERYRKLIENKKNDI